ncbi:mechanosensitive ion channel domain-containing protein [Jannaschia seohaensis]|uniref:Small conductance mechanosensitive channel n=1 Tax=Jannaschia seohaensis TaxID=475081 RepID=A0A2Y9A127_9RHOB|nr:mechanosensitive ion channel domain-containing protein [Jannaschia seohaensis]PWJ21872.1 small conductance mechanosensitive channel [Jannaschia seohaensis]SSA38150.1 small conductance mechanosensitive channel [Jannaschia seohaensis]
MPSCAALRRLLAPLFLIIAVAGLTAAPPAGAQSVSGEAGSAASADPSPALTNLIEVLRDEAAREALIAELEALTPPEAAPDSAVLDVEQTLARRLADASALLVEETLSTARTVWRDLLGFGRIGETLSAEKLDAISEAWLPLLSTILSTVGLLWLLSRLASGVLARADSTPGGDTLRETLLAVARNAVLDAVVLGLAYAAGYVLAYSVFGSSGDILVEQSLYLNAFLVAGVVRLVLRAFVRPDRPEEAISHLSVPIQRVIYRRVKALSWLLVYGISVGVPLANAWLSLGAGRSVRVLAVTLAAMLALVSIRKVARLIEADGKAAAAQAPVDGSEAEQVVGAIGEASVQAATSAWNRIWPWLASIYVLAVWGVAVTRPRLMGEFVWGATLRTLVACALLVLAFRLLRHARRARAPLAGVVTRGLPALQSRLDVFAPAVVRLVALVLSVGAVALLVDAWTALDLGAWLSSATGAEILWRVASAALILALVVLTWAVVAAWIDQRLAQELDGPQVSARSRTLLALFRNAFTVAIFIFGLMIVLSQVGIDIAPLLAGAGVLGLAIGFGAQKLVQDIITGVFIQLENAINEGDVVTVAGITGAVEKLTIRSVGLRDMGGIYHIVPFSSVDTVSNFMRGFAYHVEVVGIAYAADIETAKAAMQEAFERLRAIPEHGEVIVGDLEMQGVIALSESSVDLRARIRTQPGKQWGVGRAYTELVKTVFDERGVEIPFPHRKLLIEREAD